MSLADHLLATRPGRLELGLHAVVHGAGVGLGRGPDVGRRLVGLLDPAGQDALGFEAQAGAVLVGLLHHAGHALLGLRAHVGSCLARATQDARRLLAERRGQRDLVELGVGQLPAGLVEGPAHLLLALTSGNELLADLLQEAADLVLVVAAEHHGERTAGDLVRREAGLGRDDDAVVRHIRVSLEG